MRTFTVTAHARRYVAGRIGNRVNAAESAFLGPNAMMMNDLMNDLGLQTRRRHAYPTSAR